MTDDLNSKIEATLDNQRLLPGLGYGKMGLCVHFYRLARSESNEKYGKIAERLLDEVFEDIGTVKLIDIENGLAGIGLGISYLIRNGYVQGDENHILRDVDDEIFKQISSPKPTNEDVRLQIQILLLKAQSQHE
jgi:lantibiotic modifying enzyme